VEYVLPELPTQPPLLPQQTEFHLAVVPVANVVQTDNVMDNMMSTMEAKMESMRIKPEGLEHVSGSGYGEYHAGN